jgi:hypothetical protein
VATGITLHVHDTGLQPVQNVRVEAYPLRPENRDLAWHVLEKALWVRRTQNAEGTYVLPELAAGEYGIRGARHGCRRGTVAPARVRAHLPAHRQQWLRRRRHARTWLRALARPPGPIRPADRSAEGRGHARPAPAGWPDDRAPLAAEARYWHRARARRPARDRGRVARRGGSAGHLAIRSADRWPTGPASSSCSCAPANDRPNVSSCRASRVPG